MEWLAPAIVAIGGIITAIAALRRVNIQGEIGLSDSWKSFTDGVKKELEETRRRLREVEEAREKDSHEMDAQQEQIRDLEEKERVANERLRLVENDHTKLREEHVAIKEAFTELEARFERYRKGVVLLIKQIVEHGLVPVWQPDEDNHKES